MRARRLIGRLVAAGAPIDRCCRVLEVARQNHYKAKRRPTTPTQLRRHRLTGLIREIQLLPEVPTATAGFRRTDHGDGHQGLLPHGIGSHELGRHPPDRLPRHGPRTSQCRNRSGPHDGEARPTATRSALTAEQHSGGTDITAGEGNRPWLDRPCGGRLMVSDSTTSCRRSVGLYESASASGTISSCRIENTSELRVFCSLNRGRTEWATDCPGLLAYREHLEGGSPLE